VTGFAGRGTDSLIEKANSRGLKVYVHTYNTEEEREEFFERGFWGLYTDSLPPVEQ
jgi:glycerophosphoryl diester phosphodiesterase